MSTPTTSTPKLDSYKLETEFYDDLVVHIKYEWNLSKRAWGKSIWRQERIIGIGAHGEVWLERETGGDLRAVKRLRRQPTMKMGPTQELLAFVKLKDESIPEITYTKLGMKLMVDLQHAYLFLDFFGWYENKDQIFIAMEYIEYGNLGEYMKNSQQARVDAQEITRQILEGLEVLHGKEICHRDLKPAV